MSVDQKIKKWERRIQVIHQQVSLLVWSCNSYSETRRIVTSNPEINTDNRFYKWITMNHIHATLMGIRRQLDKDHSTHSLENLLSDMKDNCNLLSREQHLSLYPGEMQGVGENTFDYSLASKTVDIFPVEKLEQDLQKLEQIRSLHKEYIDKRIAHYDKVETIKAFGSIQDLDNAVSSLEEIVIRYYLLLMAQGIFSLLPISQYDWKAIFKQAWIPNTSVEDEDG